MDTIRSIGYGITERMPDLLSTKRGRLAAFFFLYVAEGIPLGFTATAVATQMRRQGLGVAEIGAFVGSLYLPWAFKWAYGPFVDVLSSERLANNSGCAISRRLPLCFSPARTTLVSTIASSPRLRAPASLRGSQRKSGRAQMALGWCVPVSESRS